MHDIEFLIDENVLGLSRYLDVYKIKYRKVGDKNGPNLKSDDATVAKFAHEEGLVVLTNDDKLKKQCELLDVGYVFHDLSDFAKKVKKYSDGRRN